MHCERRITASRPYSSMARIYDLMSGRSDFVRTRRIFERLVHRHAIAFRSAVDVGCGTGLFACYLNRRWGVPVIGVDQSPEMLAVARQNCPNLDVCFLLQDFQHLCLPWRVELAIANSCTLNHVMQRDHLRETFSAIRENLRPGSYFIFDLITDRQPQHLSKGCTRHIRIGRSRILHRSQWHPLEKLLRVIITLESNEFPRATEVFMGRGYGLRDVDHCLSCAGFVQRGMYDANNLGWAMRDSQRVVVVAVRK
jgi:SAM-dependent methyltransferase